MKSSKYFPTLETIMHSQHFWDVERLLWIFADKGIERLHDLLKVIQLSKEREKEGFKSSNSSGFSTVLYSPV